MNAPRRALPIFDPTMQSSLRGDGTRRDVQPADVRGRFARARRVGFALLLALYVALPLVHINGRPAVFLDVDRREFCLFGATFGADDLWLSFFLLTGVGAALLLLTTLAGRVWCGWACPQTVFLDALYRPIERAVQGPRERRLHRNAGPATWDRLWRKGVTHVAWGVVSLALGHVLASYFVSMPGLLRMMHGSPGLHPQAFAWVAVISLLLYVDQAFFREQLCLVVCPYGRLQSALSDPDTINVGYDARRGEPRGKATQPGHGDCVDCGRCVAVCPTGIDIRNGLQVDCVACTACVDACDEIMDKLAKPRGLVRYASQRVLDGESRRILRPRVALYAGLMAVGALVAALSARGHRDFEATLLRLPGTTYTLDDGVVRDALTVHLVNKTSTAMTLALEPEAVADATFTVPLATVTLPPLGSVEAPVFVGVPRGRFAREFPVRLRVRAVASHAPPVVLSAPFLGPST